MNTRTNRIKIFAVILLVIGFNCVLFPENTRASTLDKSAPHKEFADDKFDKVFREGRDLIDKEEWAKAAEKFKQIVCDCPENKKVDTALYWLAFCQKKLRQLESAGKTLDLLLKNYPNSSWADDARVLQYEIRPALATNLFGRASSVQSARADDLSLAKAQTGAFAAFAPQIPLDREDEIKLAAFQSLSSADPKRGIEVLGSLLKNDSKSSETLKREVLRSLRSPRLSGQITGGEFNFEYLTANESRNQFTPLLRETLVKSYQNESNDKIRMEIIYALGSLNDEQSFEYIVQLYASENNKEIKKAIINSFGSTLYNSYGAFGFAGAAKIIQTEKVASNANVTRQTHLDKLLEIVRTEKDFELKRLAFSNLQKFVEWSEKGKVIELISRLYDDESDEQFKTSIIRSFAASKQNEATAKLLNIAKNDKSDKLRLEAIRSLSTSKNPEVLKFLEDLIK